MLTKPCPSRDWSIRFASRRVEVVTAARWLPIVAVRNAVEPVIELPLVIVDTDDGATGGEGNEGNSGAVTPEVGFDCAEGFVRPDPVGVDPAGAAIAVSPQVSQ
jgi:hypothetical protein